MLNWRDFLIILFGCCLPGEKGRYIRLAVKLHFQGAKSNLSAVREKANSLKRANIETNREIDEIVYVFDEGLEHYVRKAMHYTPGQRAEFVSLE